MADPKPISLTQVDAEDFDGDYAPQPFVVVGDIPGAGGGATAWADVTGKPTTFAPITGTAANQAMPGNTVIPAAATWANISGKPAVVAAGADAAAARAAIGAGTGNGSSNLAIGTTAGTAADAGALVTSLAGKAATSHNQAATTVTVAASTGIVGANVQLVLADLAARVVALEAETP